MRNFVGLSLEVVAFPYFLIFAFLFVFKLFLLLLLLATIINLSFYVLIDKIQCITHPTNENK